MGTVISLYHRHRFLIVIIIEQGILCLFETKIRSMMKTKIFIFLVVAAFIGCIFAEDVELGGLGVGMNAMRSRGLNRGDCVPRFSICHPLLLWFQLQTFLTWSSLCTKYVDRDNNIQ